MNPSIRLLAFLLLAVVGTAQATTLSVSIDTSALSGTAASLAFDLIDGDGSSGNNSVSISGFTSDATLGSASVSGGASGSLPAVTLTDSSGFNELLQFLSLGISISFTVTLTDNHGTAGSDPDQFAFFLLDGFGINSLVATTQPVGANALFTYDITGHKPGSLQVYSPVGGTGNPAWTATIVNSSGLPEPGTLALFGLGGLLLRGASRKGIHHGFFRKTAG